MKQYRYQCCGYIVSERFEDTHCRQCGRLSPILEEVDKEEMVYMLPAVGHSGDESQETREWGNFKILLDEPNVKKIGVELKLGMLKAGSIKKTCGA